MKPTPFLLLGYPGAGKSTVSTLLAERFNIARINGDDIRRYMYDNADAIRNVKNNHAVFGALDYVAETLLAASSSVIYDANINRLKDRVRAGKLTSKYDARAVLVWVRTPLDVAKKRNEVRTPDEGYDRIPDERYEQLVTRLQEPTDQETIIEINELADPNDQLQSLEDAVRQIGIL